MRFSFVHTADIHLGRAFSDINFDLSAEQKTILNTAHEKALEELANFAVDKSVDFILIAGDTFDDCEQDLHSRLILSRFLSLMESEGISVYMVCGNHDPETSYSKDLSFKDSEKINIFGVNRQLAPLVVNKEGHDVATIYPFGFASNECRQSPCEFLQKAVNKNVFNIGLIHCDMTTPNNVYAPCTERALAELDYDYYALGHIHKPMIVDKFVYPGTIQGRSRKDEGEHGFRHVVVDNGNIISNDFIVCDKVRFYNHKYSITDDTSAIETVENLIKELNSLVKGCKFIIINLTLTGVCSYKKIDVEELRKSLSDDYIVVSGITDNSVVDIDIEQVATTGGVLSEIINLCSSEEACKVVLKETEKELKEAFKLVEDVSGEEILATSMNELKNICAEVYGGEDE